MQFNVNARSLAYWNATTHAWVVENEPIRLDAGASLADIRSSKTITMRERSFFCLLPQPFGHTVNDILAQPLTVQILVLLVLSGVVACVAWTVTREEVFREPREFCAARSKSSKSVLVRKFFYLFTCEYCFSHYVSAGIILGTGYRLLIPDWRGAIVAWFTLVWVANFQMSAFARIRLEVKLDRIEIDAKADENGAANAANGQTASPAEKEPRL